MSARIYTNPDPPLNAYCYARRIQEGCQHRLGCKCGVPYWLRAPSPAEVAWVERHQLPGEGKETA